MTTIPARLALQVRDEQRSFWRNPASAFFTFVFPPTLLVIFGTLLRSETVPVGESRVPFTDYLVPSILGFAVMSSCFYTLASIMVLRRDAGILKRLRSSPMPGWALLAGIIGSCLIVAALLTVLVMGVGFIGFELPAPDNWGRLVLTLVVGSITFTVAGLAITSWLPNGEAAQTTLTAVFYPICFMSGAVYPVPQDSFLYPISRVLPVQPFIAGLVASFSERSGATPWRPGDLLILLAWSVVGAILATKYFRWLPRNAR